MTANFVKLMSSDASRALQLDAGSRNIYAAVEARGDGETDLLGAKEVSFIKARDSFYMATVTTDGWPYVQHRGGPAGFVHCLGPRQIAFADYSGNRQYMSAGNLACNNRVALIMLDYVARRRLKLVGAAHRVSFNDHAETMQQLMPKNYSAQGEGAIIIDVIAFDWNCPQHITQRWTAIEIEQMKGAEE